jgi:two-component system response regulator RstA
MLKKRIHIIDPDPRFVQTLREQFLLHDLEVNALEKLDDVRFLSEVGAPHLIVLTSGAEEVLKIREVSEIPIIAILANQDIELKIGLLEAGADHCLFQPIEVRVLVAKVRASLRRWPSFKIPKLGRHPVPRVAMASIDHWRFKGLVIELNRRRVLLNNEIIDLTTAEFDLLKLFVTNVYQVLTRDTILAGLRGISWDAMDRSADILVSRLREKLGDDPKRPRFIQTVRSMGYQFVGETE